MARALHIVLVSAVTHALAQTALAEAPIFSITIKDHRFSPESIEIPADTKVKLDVSNEDLTPEEFESYELNREKVIPGNGKVSIFIGPLAPGEYPFVGEFNSATALGKIVVK